MSNVQEFGAVGDGIHDDTAAIQHALNEGDGCVWFPRGDYKIVRPLLVDLTKFGRRAIRGEGGTARIAMYGAGPAILLRASHGATADPGSFREEEWQHERMPTVADIEIVGHHQEADGIEIRGVMQPTLTGVLIRRVRHAVHVVERARNIIIDHCHFYHNTGAGVFLDGVNLHQSIICSSHISYCRLGGIRIEGSEIRNLQITGNDIEYNNNASHGIEGADGVATAEIYIDVGDAGEGSIREGTISSNTIQATDSPNGANIRIIGNRKLGSHRAGMWTITGNLIGSQRQNVHLRWVRGVTLTGNYIYSSHERNLLVQHSRNIVVGSNVFGHNPDYDKKELATGIRFEDSHSCNLHGNVIEDAEAGTHTVETVPLERLGLIELERCQRMSITGTQILDPTPCGLHIRDCDDLLIQGCTIHDAREKMAMTTPIDWQGKATTGLISGCRIGRGTGGGMVVPENVTVEGNAIQ
ncbi:MAG: right-handed parallel beta-helix repeat-containing protein [Pirellulaceae bacterium]|nr:right-handed parallel beta-helix repeat-containing protein [Pirellulaceae bacterium]